MSECLVTNVKMQSQWSLLTVWSPSCHTTTILPSHMIRTMPTWYCDSAGKVLQINCSASFFFLLGFFGGDLLSIPLMLPRCYFLEARAITCFWWLSSPFPPPPPSSTSWMETRLHLIHFWFSFFFFFCPSVLLLCCPSLCVVCWSHPHHCCVTSSARW